MASALSLSERLGFGPDDVYPIAWPFSHIGGIAMLVTSLNTGVRLVLFDVFDPATTADRMATHNPTMLGSAVPFFRAFLEAEHRHEGGSLFPNVRGCVGGGAPIPGDVNQELIDTFGVAGVVGAYGLTEVPNCTCEWFDGPVALSGSIATGGAILAAQAMGADFAYVGSAFIATDEARASDDYKQAVVDGSSDDVVLSNLFTGVNGNYLAPSIRNAGLDPDNLPESDPSKMNFGGGAQKAWKDIWGCGQGIGVIKEVVPAATLVARLKREYQEAKQRLAS
jgi:hypothetical protein